jgi:hypothetical protein
VASCATWKVAQGAARVQATPPPVDDTKVRGMAWAGATWSATRRLAAAAENRDKVFMAGLDMRVC